MVQAIVFDMDGTLIDSEPFWSEAERRVFGDLGVDVTSAMAQKTAGMTTKAVTQFWYEQSPWSGPSLAIVEQTVVDTVALMIEKRGKPLPGVPSVVNQMKEAGYKLALVTNSPRVLVPFVFDRLGLQEVFEVVCTIEDAPRGKPAPDLYLAAAKQLCIPATRCLAVEDSATGLQSALSAGMRTVAVVPYSRKPHRLFHLADIQLRSLMDLTERAIRSLS